MSLARSCDVIVIGGGAAGTAAAVGAANAGAQTLLVESGPFLGGAATLKNVLTYCGLFTNYQKKQAVFGVADQVLQRLREMGAISEPIQFHGVAVLIEPESVKYVLDQLCKHAGVQICLHTMFLSATRSGNHITSVTLHDHQGNHEVSAQAFVDASGEGDLAFFGGASVRYGNRDGPDRDVKYASGWDHGRCRSLANHLDSRHSAGETARGHTACLRVRVMLPRSHYKRRSNLLH